MQFQSLGGGRGSNSVWRSERSGRSSGGQHSESTARRLLVLPPLDAPPPLLRFVRLVCGEEGHSVGPEVCVEVRGLIEAPAAHPAAEVSVLSVGLRGGAGGAVRRTVRPLGATLPVAMGVSHSVGDEAVAAQRAG